MKALVQDTYGSADVLHIEDVEVPAMGDGDVLLDVRAASFNPLDWHFMRGAPFFIRLAGGGGLRRPRQRIRGVDVAGVVKAVGPAVTGFAPGDEVFGFCQGAAAEIAVTGQDRLLPKPSRLTFEEAAAVPVAGITALQGLRDQGGVGAGHTVLIIGASGGVGTFAIQIAKAFGAEVTGVCSTRNVDLVKSIGADHVFDYTKGDVTESGERFDVIFQLAGAASPLRLRRILAPEGTLVLSSGDGRLSGIDRIIIGKLMGLAGKQRVTTWVADENKQDLAVLAEMLESGDVTPVVDRTYPLADAAEALRYVEEGHTRGKVVVAV